MIAAQAYNWQMAGS